MCIKLDFEEIILILTTNGQSDKGFLLTSKVCPKGVDCPWGLYTCIKALNIYQDQVSGERLTGHWSSGFEYTILLKSLLEGLRSVAFKIKAHERTESGIYMISLVPNDLLFRTY